MRALLIVLALTFAGCVDSSDPSPADNSPLFVDTNEPIPVEGEGHDHRDPDQHRFARQATLLDHDNLQRFGWHEQLTVGAHAVARHGDVLAVAVFGDHANEGQQGFHLFDVSNPSDLVHLAFFDAGSGVGGDRTIAFSHDGKTVFLGYEQGRPGVGAVDVSNPLLPLQVAFWEDPQGYGSHTVASGLIAGDQYVFSLALGVNILRFTGDSFEFVGKYVTADEAAILDTPQHAREGEEGYMATYALRTVYAHDMNFYADPETGLPLLLVAYAYDGAKILDLTNPSIPVPMGRWLPPQDTSHKHYTHSISAERIDGRLILVVGSETFEDENQHIASPIWILDATEAVASGPGLDRAEHLGTWSNPDGAAAGLLGLSVHFFRQLDGFAYLSHYHGGVWAFDLRTDEARRAPEAFGFIMPVPDNPVAPPEECCIGFDLDGIPMVFDIEVDEEGVVYSADIVQGLTSIQFERPS